MTLFQAFGQFANQTQITPSAYQSIGSTLLASDSSTITFSSIPSTYKHLEVRICGNTSRSATLDDLGLRVNSDSGSNYSYSEYYASGTSTAAAQLNNQTTATIGTLSGATAGADHFMPMIVRIFDYANTAKITTAMGYGGYVQFDGQKHGFFTMLWNDTSAVNELTFSTRNATDFKTGTRMSLYGILG